MRNYSQKPSQKTAIVIKTLLGDHNLFIEGHSDYITYMIISNDNQHLIWKIPEMYQKAILYGHNAKIYCIAIAENHKFLVSGSCDKTIESEIFRLIKKYL